MLSLVNGLKNSPKILNIPQRDFFNLNCLDRINKYSKGSLVQISTVYQTIYYVTC